MRFFFFILSCCIHLASLAQQSEFEDPKYTREKKVDKSITVEFNVGLGILDVESITMSGLQATYGLQLGDHFTVGAGSGIHLYESDRFLPLYSEFRYLPGDAATRFMAGSSIGAYYGWEQSEWDRYINPFLGFSYQNFDNLEFTFSIGLIYKEYDVKKPPVRLPGGGAANISGTNEVIGRFFSVRFGCRF